MFSQSNQIDEFRQPPLRHPLAGHFAPWIIACYLLASGAIATAAFQAQQTLSQPLYPVRGRLICNQSVAVGAENVLHPLASEQTSRVRANQPHPRGVVAADGTFDIRTLGWGTGAPPGKYAVTAKWRPFVVDGEDYRAGPNRLPSRYADSRTTPLRIHVAPSYNELPSWSLPACDCEVH